MFNTVTTHQIDSNYFYATISRLLFISNAPFNTPKNIEDAYIRDSRNEPANISFLLTAAAAARKPAVLPAALAAAVLVLRAHPLHGTPYSLYQALHIPPL